MFKIGKIFIFWGLCAFSLNVSGDETKPSLEILWKQLQSQMKGLPSLDPKALASKSFFSFSNKEMSREEMLELILKNIKETQQKKFSMSPSLPDLINEVPEIPAQRQEYQLKPGDRIEISVWGEDMTRELIVSPDGSISYLLIGQLDVLNKTFRELKITIEQKLSDYLLEPNVTIIGKSYEGNYVSILGAVNAPGRKSVVSSDRILDILSKANGLRYEEFGNNQGEVANLKSAYLSRGGKLIPVDFSKLIYEGDMSQNIALELGDFIYIPSSVGSPIFITGEVNSPKSMPFRGTPTLLEAITEGGGFNIQGNRNTIFVVRGGVNSSDISKFSFSDIIKGKVENPKLNPGDIIYVPPTTLTRIERISTQIIPFLNTIISTKSSKDALSNW
jgi:polysaccharide biosynthesis/export protein